METINNILSGALVPLFLAFCAVFLLMKLSGKPLIKPRQMLKSMLKKEKNGGVSPIRAVIFALAGTLGVGNIVGVASAIALGGAGAVVWMWISALLAMILKYSEVVLGVLHRRRRNGENFGGTMYYMRDYFNSCQKYGTGIIFSIIFTIFCLLNAFSMGCIIQANAISEAVCVLSDTPTYLIGIILALLSVVVFFLNGQKIFAICAKLVPLVSVVYLVISLLVICKNYEKLPDIFEEMLKDAFDFGSASAGVLGFGISRALRYGTIRGLFSNEAGCGTSPIAHALSNTSSPCEQGFLGIVEVFIDTILVCTMTALVILINREAAFSFTDRPIMMAFAAFSATLGRFSDAFLSISVFLFAFATIICWGYYGKECIYFLNKDKKAEKAYYFIYIFFVFLGAQISLDFIWQIADLAVGVMTIMNLSTLLLMSGEIKRETDNYFIKKELPKGSSEKSKN